MFQQLSYLPPFQNIKFNESCRIQISRNILIFKYFPYFFKKYIEILKQFNILISKYFPYLKILNIFKYYSFVKVDGSESWVEPSMSEKNGG